jgi:hypothetical protein
MIPGSRRTCAPVGAYASVGARHQRARSRRPAGVARMLGGYLDPSLHLRSERTEASQFSPATWPRWKPSACLFCHDDVRPSAIRTAMVAGPTTVNVTREPLDWGGGHHMNMTPASAASSRANSARHRRGMVDRRLDLFTRGLAAAGHPSPRCVPLGRSLSQIRSASAYYCLYS